MKQPAAVILAGGQARRMGGGDKALLTLAGRPLLSHVLDRIEPQVAGLCLNANGDADRFSRFGVPVVADSIDGFVGPLAGVLAGLDWAAERGHDHVVSIAADTPFFPPDLVPYLLMGLDNGPIVLAKTGKHVHPTFGIWPVDLRDDLRAALTDGTRKVLDWTDRHDATTMVFPATTPDPFFNINTPDDLATAEAYFAKDAS
jgi:molybdopterin-guanine dinucleotide biosynthesis protein A